jgi:cbb3-type cytochrome oxidase subunit 3
MTMRLVIAVVMFIIWIAIAYREYQRGETRLAAAFLLIGIALTVYRYRIAKKSAAAKDSRKS